MSRHRHNKQPQQKKQQPAKPQIFHSADRRNLVGAPVPQKPFNPYHKKPTAR